MGKTLCSYNNRFGGAQGFYDKSTAETYSIAKPLVVSDDFVGADVVIPAAGSPESGTKWTGKITGAAPPTVAKTGDGVNGLVACSLTSDSQAQEAALEMNDELMASIAQGAIFEARLSVLTAPTLNGVASWGLYGAYAAGGSNYRAGFEITAASLIPTCEVDDAVTDTALASGVTLVVGTYYIFRIDATTQTDIKFYIDGARVAGASTFASAASAANSKMQPHFGVYKASGAGLGVISVDYVKVWQDRS